MLLEKAPAYVKFMARRKHNKCLVCNHGLGDDDMVFIAQTIADSRWVAAGACCFKKISLDTICRIKVNLGKNPSRAEKAMAKARIRTMFTSHEDPPFDLSDCDRTDDHNEQSSQCRILTFPYSNETIQEHD
ncbi:MAG: hypothetical protein C0617_12135 [Desulfuromonas sp.]|uniref:hypothetical protein n=1 Tax=Desulfuromonas sp. TaxID=892 RepID=UPI000CC4FD58|nr:hypothetical protein [Desulfuromonas sp.]PLX83274.1 MAG: hypothetical protein C0617_12135 [Desulfuromonas sp.]